MGGAPAAAGGGTGGRMETAPRKRSVTTALILHIALFYCAWSVFELLIHPRLAGALRDEALRACVESGVKCLVWTAPAVALIRRFGPDIHITLKEMVCARVRWRRYLPVAALFAVLVLGGAYLENGRIEINRELDAATLVSSVLFVGLTEEAVFRGWLLNATVGRGKWPAILLNAVMFLLIHFPIWIARGVFVSSFASFGFCTIMALSVIFSVCFLKSGSILAPVALHMWWNLLVALFR